jgi:hypothetical protein
VATRQDAFSRLKNQWMVVEVVLHTIWHAARVPLNVAAVDCDVSQVTGDWRPCFFQWTSAYGGAIFVHFTYISIARQLERNALHTFQLQIFRVLDLKDKERTMFLRMYSLCDN